MTNAQSFAARELDLLSKSATDPENRPLIEEFRDEILALCEKFGNSGQSGGSAPFTAAAISSAIKKLLLFEPICPITGFDEEWVDVSQYSPGEIYYQNSRCSSLFREGVNEPSSYIYAIVWQGERKYDTFTGTVYLDNTFSERIGSSQYVKAFPFTPKTFYIDVVYTPITKEEAEEKGMHYIEANFGECYYTTVKDPSQLDAVWEYYNKRAVVFSNSKTEDLDEIEKQGEIPVVDKNGSL